MNKIQLLKSFYVKKDYDTLIKLLIDRQDLDCDNLIAKVFLMQKNLEQAEKYFLKNNQLYELGYISILKGELEKTKTLWDTPETESSALLWGKFLLSCLNKKPDFENPPTFFQIRNFFEVDLNMLISFNQITLANNLLSYVDNLAMINPETYKYTARILHNQALYQQSLIMLNKFTDFLYNDCEAHYLIAKNYLALNNLSEAKISAQKSLEIVKNYYPALELVTKLELKDA